MADFDTLEQMRQWLFDNGWDGAHSWTDRQVQRMIDRKYKGGLHGFSKGR